MSRSRPVWTDLGQSGLIFSNLGKSGVISPEISRKTTRRGTIRRRIPCIREPKFQAQGAFSLPIIKATIHRSNIAKSYIYMRTSFIFAIHGANRPCKPRRLKHSKTYTFLEKRSIFEFCAAFRAYFRQHQGCKEFRSKTVVFSHKR